MALGAAALFAALIRQIVATGPLTLRRPPTVLSNGRPEPAAFAPYLSFLSVVRKELPPGAVVAILLPADDPDLLIATGQLPSNPIIRAGEPAWEKRAAYIAAYEQPLPAGRGSLIDPTARGFLYRNVP